MQHGPSIISMIVIFLLLAGIAWLGGRILCKWHEIYAGQRLRYAYWGATMLSVAILIFSRWLRPAGGFPGEWFRYFIYFAYVWIIGLVFMLVVLLAGYVVKRLVGRFAANRVIDGREQPGPDEADTAAEQRGITRRQFLGGMSAAIPAVPLAVSAYGVIGGDMQIVMNRHTLAFPQLPPLLAGFKIAQISDTHIGSFFGMDKLDRVLSMVKQERPEMLVITGDLIDDLALLSPTMERLAAFQSQLPQGIFFCWGNHEYFRNINSIRKALDKSPIVVLENSNKAVGNGLYLAGVDYPWSKDKGGQEVVRRQFFAQAIRGIPADAFTVLLTHHSSFLDDAFAAGIPLSLAGHTHGGQVNIFGKSLLPVQYKYMRGMFRQGDSYGYVSVGTGHWLPLRIGCPAEVSVFTLQRETTRM